MNGQLVYVRDTQCHKKLLTRPLIVQQVKHHHDWFDDDLQYSIQLGSVWWNLVDLPWMPNDVHEERQCSV